MYVTLPTVKADNDLFPTIAGPRYTTKDTRLRANRTLYSEGDEVDWLFQVKSGVLRLSRMLENGRRQVIAFGYPGDIVGFPFNGRYNADCQTLTDVRLRPYRRSVLESGECTPELHQQFLQAALYEIGAMQDHFMVLGRRSAVEKVTSFLCALAQREGKRSGKHVQFELPMWREDIADFLGVTTETVCRTFAQLCKSGVISIEDIHTIVIRQPDTLLDLSKGDND